MNEKLFGHVFSKGDPIVYRIIEDMDKKNLVILLATGIYIGHKTFKVDSLGTTVYHHISIINKDGEKAVVNWIKPLKGE